jgi:flagellar basal body-associated protein FliL
MKDKAIMTIRILSIISTLLFAYLLTSPLCFSQNRKPSTPEERTRVVQLAHSLEANPLR